LGEMGDAIAMGRHRGVVGATSGMMLSHGGDDMVMHDSSYRSVSTAPASVAPTTGTTATSATAAEAGAAGTTRLSVSDRGTSGMSSRRRLLYPSDQLGADTALPLQPPPTMPGQAPPPHPPHLQGQEAGSATAAPHEDVEAVETSLQSLTESLDEDAISFITSMKYS
jgi:hypothetical protein